MDWRQDLLQRFLRFTCVHNFQSLRPLIPTSRGRKGPRKGGGGGGQELRADGGGSTTVRWERISTCRSLHCTRIKDLYCDRPCFSTQKLLARLSDQHFGRACRYLLHYGLRSRTARQQPPQDIDHVLACRVSISTTRWHGSASWQGHGKHACRHCKCFLLEKEPVGLLMHTKQAICHRPCNLRRKCGAELTSV